MTGHGTLVLALWLFLWSVVAGSVAACIWVVWQLWNRKDRR